MPLACPPAPLRGIAHLAITIVQEVKQSRALVDIKVQSLQMRPDLRICHDRLNYIFCGNCERKITQTRRQIRKIVPAKRGGTNETRRWVSGKPELVSNTWRQR